MFSLSVSLHLSISLSLFHQTAKNYHPVTLGTSDSPTAFPLVWDGAASALWFLTHHILPQPRLKTESPYERS